MEQVEARRSTADSDEKMLGNKAVRSAEMAAAASIFAMTVFVLFCGYELAHAASDSDSFAAFGVGVFVSAVLSLPFVLKCWATAADAKRRHMFMDRN